MKFLYIAFYLLCIFLFYCSGSTLRAKCKASVNCTDGRFSDEIEFKTINGGTSISLINGSISKINSCRSFHEDQVYLISKAPGIGVKFEVLKEVQTEGV